MDYRYAPHQVARGTRCDAESFDKIYLFKNVSMLRATYQIRLNALRAAHEKKKLVLVVPKACTFHPTLRTLMRDLDGLIRRENA